MCCQWPESIAEIHRNIFIMQLQKLNTIQIIKKLQSKFISACGFIREVRHKIELIMT